MVHSATQEAVRHFRATPCFGKGQAFAKCLSEAKKMARLLQRKQRQQEQEIKKAAKQKRGKGVSHG